METPEPSSSGSTSSSQFSRTTKASSTLSIGTKMSSLVRNRATSVSSTSTRGGCPECRDKRQDDMGIKLNTAELASLAQSLRGKSSSFGEKTSTAFDYTVEIIFEDGVSWVAKVPKPWRSSHYNEAMYSQISAWRYLKKHTSIPVPEVFYYAYDSDPANNVAASFMLYEKLPGHHVPELDVENPTSIGKAARFHGQLADVILQLSTCTFESIGSIQQSATDSDDFSVGPLYSVQNTYPLARGRAATNRGPYTSAFEYLTAFGELNYKDAKSHSHRPAQSDLCAPVDEELARFFLINKMIPKFSVETGYNNGPFVFQNWGLNSTGILVDDECNITGVTGITGVVGPITSLCKYPDIIYETKKKGPLFDRKIFLGAFLNREWSSDRPSILQDPDVRKELLRTAHKVWQFENSILDPSQKHLHLRGRGGLYEYVFEDTKFSEKSAFKSLGDQDPDFQNLVPKRDLKHGEYSWDLPEELRNGKKRRRSSTTAAAKETASKVWNKAPWVKSRKEEIWVREYVRVHRHLPPEVKAYTGKRRSNGPEKAFHMAWAFIRCRDASYMKRKTQKKRVVRVTGRNRSSSVRQTGKRVRGWSLTGADKKGKGKGKMPAVARVATGPTVTVDNKGWKRMFAAVTMLNFRGSSSS
ncbi:hypothetical protein TWF730_003548 [Orbilia blumenaviensis]|uniref:Aminoglycoside phosphotransferase domain-containing protein n=1 Tax=Orbilia blumenaviensis TaxID=1796055 RepID=A0AAV9U6M2_9PEZI